MIGDDNRPGDIAAIAAVIHRYSQAMDYRDWALMDDVFLPDAEIAMGEVRFFGRAAGVEAIRACIECCSVTHHMNSNIVAAFDGDTAVVRNQFRAWHRGIGEKADQVFEGMGSYADRFVKTPVGWRIALREEQCPVSIGATDLFADAAPVWQRLTGGNANPAANLI